MGEITRGDVEGFIGHLLDTRTASTAATRYRGLQQFFKWALQEREITTSPMAAMRPPKLEDKPVPVVGVEALQALLRVCEGRGFDQRRDKAILSVFIDTGARVSEVAGLQLSDVDLDSPRREVPMSSARAASTVRSVSGRAPCATWTATCASVIATVTRACRRCGSPRRAP